MNISAAAFALFDTAVGPCALVWGAQGLVGVLLPELYEMYNPMPYDGARDMEVELAIALREAGYGVWQA